jgi:nucleosome assembly protein 1-like 1
MIQDYDEPILSNLRDVRVKLNDKMGYDIQFYFKENEYFTNTVLTKTYAMSTELDPKDPFNFDGPEIYKSTGCTINWKEGKNVTVTKSEKKQKNKNTGETRTVNKDEMQDSFFNFFNTPTETGIKPSYRRAMMPTDADKQLALRKVKIF